MLAITILVSAALAGDDSVTALRRQMTAPHAAGSTGIFSCAPASGLLATLVEQIPPERLQAAVASGRRGGFIVSLLVGAQQAGLSLEGPISTGWYEDSSAGWVAFAFPSTPQDAEALLTTSSLGPALPEEGGWRLSGDWVARLEEGLLLVATDRPASAPAEPPVPALLSGLSEAPGCTAWAPVKRPLAKQAQMLAGAQLVVQLPMEGSVVSARLASARPAPAALAHAVAGPVGGSSAERPALVVGLGVTPYALVETGLGPLGSLDATQLARLKRALPLGPGATLALFGEPRTTLSFVAVLPVEGALTPRRLARRARRAVEQAGGEISRVGATDFEARVGTRLVTVVARRGRLYIGEEPARVAEVADGVGRPWLSDASVQRVTTWPITAWSGPISGRAGPPISLEAGVRARDGVWEIEAQLQVPEGDILDRMIMEIQRRP